MTHGSIDSFRNDPPGQGVSHPSEPTGLDLENIKHYYGTVLRESEDLKTSACCATNAATSPMIRAALARIEEDVVRRFYGCGSPIPPLLEGCTVLDLGCGTGRDVYLAAQLVGPTGRVIGVDMTDEQLVVARKHLDTHMARFGYAQSNVIFCQGYIEDLASMGIGDDSVDVVISNCVVNLSPDKWSVFKEIFRVLKPGGEMFFSDIFSGRRIPEALRANPVLHGECLAGAMYREDFRRMLREMGCPDYRMMDSRRIALNDPEVSAKIGMVDFYSTTVRAFKLDQLEDICEDYGQIAWYWGTIPEWPHYFDLDDHHRFFTGKPVLVCGNTAAMLQYTRYYPHFSVQGDRSIHYGLFDCALAMVPSRSETDVGGSCC